MGHRTFIKMITIMKWLQRFKVFLITLKDFILCNVFHFSFHTGFDSITIFFIETPSSALPLISNVQKQKMVLKLRNINQYIFVRYLIISENICQFLTCKFFKLQLEQQLQSMLVNLAAYLFTEFTLCHTFQIM